MSEVKHTPMPWVLGRNGAIHGGPFVEYTRGKAQPQVALATLHDEIPLEERDANACLIAAAPDMLAALKYVQRELAYVDGAWKQIVGAAIETAEPK